MTTWNRTAGDGGPDLVVQLDGIDNLGPVTGVVGRVSRDGEAVAELAGSVIDAALRHVQLDVSVWLPTAVEELYDLKTVVTLGGGDSPVSWPEIGYDHINVTAQR